MKTFWKPMSGNHLVVACPCCRTRFNEDLDEHSEYFSENPRAVVYYLQTFNKFCGACGQQLIKETGSTQRVKQKFVYDFDAWLSISIICLVAFACVAMLIFGS